MGRAPCCDKANVKRGPWSPEEDKQLKEYIEKDGTGGNWISLPQKAGLRRCGKSCRLRWLNYLRPNIKLGGFSDDEDRIICSLFATIGSRWSIIAAQLPGRTDNDIKNYWHTKLKKKLLGLPPSHRKPHHQQQRQHQLQEDLQLQRHQHQPQFCPSNFETTASFSSSVPGLEGTPISPYFLNSFVATSSSHSTPYPTHQSANPIMFRGDGSSTQIGYGREHMVGENYPYGGLETEKLLLLLGGSGGSGEGPPGYNIEEATPAVCPTSAATDINFRNPARAMYHC